MRAGVVIAARKLRWCQYKATTVTNSDRCQAVDMGSLTVPTERLDAKAVLNSGVVVVDGDVAAAAAAAAIVVTAAAAAFAAVRRICALLRRIR